MAVEKVLIELLSKIMPPKNNPEIPPEMILHYEQKFKRYYIWHGILGVTIMFGIPAITWFSSGFWEALWYLKQPDALFSFVGEEGILGLSVGMMLGFAFAVPLANWFLKGYIGTDMMEIYQVWYDQHPNHTLNSVLLGRAFMWIFLPIALCVALGFRYDYTFVTQENLIRNKNWSISKEVIALKDIIAVEMQIGKIAPNGQYWPGFRYRFRFKNHAPWESIFFSGSNDTTHLQYRPMIDFVLKKTGLTIEDIVTEQK